jgi:hypothetical protein
LAQRWHWRWHGSADEHLRTIGSGRADAIRLDAVLQRSQPGSAPTELPNVGGTLFFAADDGASDLDGSPITYSIVANGSKGIARITNATTGAFTYTPNAGASGPDYFTYQASDGQTNSKVATITVTISNPKIWLPLVLR